MPISPIYDPFVAKAYESLVEDCNKIMKHHIMNSDIPLIDTIMKRFYQLDFIDTCS